MIGTYGETASRTAGAMATRGMVTAPHALATQAGVDVLRAGGNAVDAAIAVVATLSVVYPHMCGLGGDNFWLIHAAGPGSLRALNGSGRSGERASIAFYRDQGLDRIPVRGFLAANTVPGAVSGWDAAYRFAREAMGPGLPWPRLLESAIGYARDGFPVSPGLASWLATDAATTDRESRHLGRFPDFTRTFLKPGGRPYAQGEVMHLPELARTLECLAADGADAFYRGPIAARIADFLQAHGGILTREDFAAHRADWVEPLRVPYRGLSACNCPPNSQGLASLEILNILNRFDVKSLGEGSADHYHLLVEATKQAFADRDRYLTDPDFAPIPVDRLLSAAHARDQAVRIDMARAARDVAPLDPKGDTVWIGVVDARGNAVSLIQSLYYDFGSGVVAGDTGVLLQNRGTFFSLDPGHVNCLQPRKRTFHTLNPAMLLRDGRPYFVYGTMGGEGQPQTQAALVTRVVDFGFSPQEAVIAPRWLHGRTWGAIANDLKLESRIDPAVVAELRRRGHPVTLVPAFAEVMGHAGAILVDPATGVRLGAADPRGDGLAAGY